MQGRANLRRLIKLAKYFAIFLQQLQTIDTTNPHVTIFINKQTSQTLRLQAVRVICLTFEVLYLTTIFSDEVEAVIGRHPHATVTTCGHSPDTPLTETVRFFIIVNKMFKALSVRIEHRNAIAICAYPDAPILAQTQRQDVFTHQGSWITRIMCITAKAIAVVLNQTLGRAYPQKSFAILQ